MHDLSKRFSTPLDYYNNRLQALAPILMDMHIRGMRIDQTVRKKLLTTALATRAKHEEFLQTNHGFVPNTKSYIDMEKFYNQIGVKFSRTPTGRASSKEDQMLAYAQRFPEARESLLACLAITEQRTVISGFLAPSVDVDGFYHPLYTLNGTGSGRFAGKGALEGGPQPQNWPRPIRAMVIPDGLGYCFSQYDLAQAEAMTTAWDAGDPLLIKTFTSINPLTGKKYDVHSVRASVLFREWKSEELPPPELLATIKRVCPIHEAQGDKECAESERQIGKITGHSSNYMAGARNLATIVLPKAGIFLPEGTVKKYQDLLISKYIKQWWNDTEKQLKRSPIMYNAAGRYRQFYGLLDHEMLRTALAWKSSSVVSDIVDEAMIECYDKFQQYHSLQARIVTQTHDSLLICHRETETDAVDNIALEAFNHKLVYKSGTLTIPTDKAHGHDWNGCK